MPFYHAPCGVAPTGFGQRLTSPMSRSARAGSDASRQGSWSGPWDQHRGARAGAVVACPSSSRLRSFAGCSRSALSGCGGRGGVSNWRRRSRSSPRPAGLSWHRTFPRDAADNTQASGQAPLTTPVLHLRVRRKPERSAPTGRGSEAPVRRRWTTVGCRAGHLTQEEAPVETSVIATLPLPSRAPSDDPPPDDSRHHGRGGRLAP